MASSLILQRTLLLASPNVFATADVAFLVLFFSYLFFKLPLAQVFVRMLDGHKDFVSSVGISVEGARVATGSKDTVTISEASRSPRHALAFVMALHHRLGAGCPARELDPALVQLIGKQVAGPCWDRL